MKSVIWASCLAGTILMWWAVHRALFEPVVVSNAPDFASRRADLTDRSGRILATDTPVCRAVLSAGKPLTATARRNLLAALPSLEPATLDEIQRSARRRVLVSNQPFEACHRLRRLRLSSLSLYRDTRRAFPQRDAAAQLVGFTNLADDGVSGAELSLDRTLKSASGPVRLALDLQVQGMARRALTQAVKDYRGTSGGLIVVSAATGEVLALASLPDFDLNAHAAAPAEAKINRITESVHEFGPALSPLTWAAVQAGVDRKAGKVGERDDYVGNLQRLGLLSAVQMGLPGAARPLAPVRWRGVALAQTRRGYGIAISAAALAQGYATLSNAGRFVPLSILPSSGAAGSRQAIPGPVAAAALARLKASSLRVRGTAAGSGDVACGWTPAVWRGRYVRSRGMTTLVALVPASQAGHVGTDVIVLIIEGTRRRDCVPALYSSRELFAMLRPNL